MNNRSNSSTAVMKFSALGDIAATLPFMRATGKNTCIITSPIGKAFLKDEFSDFIVLENKSLWGLLKLIREIRKRKFSDLIDLQGNDRCLFIDRYCGALAHNGYDASKLPPPSEFVKSIRTTAKENSFFEKKPRNYIIFNTGSSAKWAAKRPPTKKWIDFAKVVNERYGLPIKLTGSADELEYVTSIAEKLPGDIEVLAGKTSLAELKPLMRNAFLTISTDSAALHISAVEKTPTIGIFGSTTHEGKSQYPWSIPLYDKSFYPTGKLPVCTAKVQNYYDHINLSEGLDLLNEYLK